MYIKNNNIVGLMYDFRVKNVHYHICKLIKMTNSDLKVGYNLHTTLYMYKKKNEVRCMFFLCYNCIIGVGNGEILQNTFLRSIYTHLQINTAGVEYMPCTNRL